jgi:hypothetical protein
MDIGSSSPKRWDFPEFTYFFPVFWLLQITAIIRIIFRLTLFDLLCSLYSWIFLLPSFLHFIPALKVKAVLRIRTRKEQKKIFKQKFEIFFLYFKLKKRSCGGSFMVFKYIYMYIYVCCVNYGASEAVNLCSSRYVEKSTKGLEQKCTSYFRE